MKVHDAPPMDLDLSSDEAAAVVENLLSALDAELVGLATAKRRVRELAAHLQDERGRSPFAGLSARPAMHMTFTGGPGTGKATVAVRVAAILHALAYISAPRVQLVTPDDLGSGRLGHTPFRISEAMERAAGGVLFMDEPYLLCGPEVLDLLMAEMEDERSDLVMILAGDPAPMSRFLAANPGLGSHLTHRVEFEDYSHAELLQIADLVVAEKNFRFDEEAREVLAEYLTRRMQRPNFCSARSVRNAIDRFRLRQARRLMGVNRSLGKQDLITITAEDVYGSSLFADPSPAP